MRKTRAAALVAGATFPLPGRCALPLTFEAAAFQHAFDVAEARTAVADLDERGAHELAFAPTSPRADDPAHHHTLSTTARRSTPVLATRPMVGAAALRAMLAVVAGGTVSAPRRERRPPPRSAASVPCDGIGGDVAVPGRG